MSKYLDLTGLAKFWGKVKALVQTCVSSVTYSAATHKITISKGDGTLTELDISRAATAAEADHADLASKADKAEESLHATNATYAECDRLGNDVAGYFKAASIIDKSLWLTRGDDEAVKVDLPDTTYEVFTASVDGLVPAPVNVGAGCLLRADGSWVDPENLVISHAMEAENAVTAAHDSENNVIAETYIAGVSVSGTTVTLQKGDGTSFTIELQDTTYGDFVPSTSGDPGEAGLVPAPPVTDEPLYLRSDGDWSAPGKITLGTATYDGSTDVSFTSAVQTLIDNALAQLVNGDEVGY